MVKRFGNMVIFSMALATFAFAGMGPAPGGPGKPSVWGPSLKSMLGTSASDQSRVYFTGYRGIVSEVFYPRVDTVNTVELQFLVGDAGGSFVDEEKLQDYTSVRPDPKAMLWQATTGNKSHNWRITKHIFTDPTRNTLIMRVTFDALGGKSIRDFNLYLWHNPAMHNSGAGDTSHTRVVSGHTMLVASEADNASALGVSLPWKMVDGHTMVSNGFEGSSDGLTDVLGVPSDKKMNWSYDSAVNGNVAQLGWISFKESTGSSLSFDVALGFGHSEGEALNAVTATLGDHISDLEKQYVSEWNNYASSLSTQKGTADAQYYLAAMSLKTIQDKSNGAMVAGLGTPWGETNGDNNKGGYHLIWARDLFKFANALVSAGDRTTANKTVNYLFNVQMQTTDCGTQNNAASCPHGYSRVGRFPQNTWVSGEPYWQGTQMDEVAMPIILAHRLNRLDLWPKVKLAANFVANVGPWTHQERWEESSGFSPSTIAAEIAGLVCAADMAMQNGDLASAKHYLQKADLWQQNVAAWTFTTTGPYGNHKYYIRISGNKNPNDGGRYYIGNGGGEHDERKIIDGGFLELVRFGVKSANDPDVLDTLVEYDNILKQDIPGKGPAWFRYNSDGYGEWNDGRNYQSDIGLGTTKGRLWPIFTAERGMYEIAKAGNVGSKGSSYLNAVRAFSTPEGFVPEQVWNLSTTVNIGEAGGWKTTTPKEFEPGTATKSIAPLSWALGEYINLMASIADDKIIDVPQVVCSRYSTCDVPARPGQVDANINVTATTHLGEWVYLTGDIAALGNWEPALGMPVDPKTYPVWKIIVNLPANTTVHYKYVRRNVDGTYTWEKLPKDENRTLKTPASGKSVDLSDTVIW